MRFRPILEQAHDWVRHALQSGDLAIDATVGNGQDTVFLAECVRPSGHVVGFDIQPAALHDTSSRLRSRGLADCVVLLHRGHEAMTDELEKLRMPTRPKVVMFNLGYRPGGDRAVITRPETTIAALNQALDLVLPGGLITVVAYPGHAGGQVEADALLAWASKVPVRRAEIVCYHLLNQKTPAPFLVAVEVVEEPGQDA
jgi:predicted methyltransferase